jgi:energy-coupling factor transporter ATP-binding protein EcfA2
MNTTSIIEKIDSHRLKDYRLISNVIQFEECIAFLEKCGRVTFGDHFKIRSVDYKIIFQLLVYFYYDLENAERLSINFNKGILLSGPVGCGKTSLMILIRFLLSSDEQYSVISTRDVRMEFLRDGFQVIEKYSMKSFLVGQDAIRPKAYCFDDLGLEGDLRYYGNETNVMAEILLGRYPLFIHQRMKTHATTNLSSDELEEVYGNRVRSRMREMFNLIAFDHKVADKRK